MNVEYGERPIDYYGFWDRLRIFFVQNRFKVRKGKTVRYYKIYKGYKVLIRTEDYRDSY